MNLFKHAMEYVHKMIRNEKTIHSLKMDNDIKQKSEILIKRTEMQSN